MQVPMRSVYKSLARTYKYQYLPGVCNFNNNMIIAGGLDEFNIPINNVQYYNPEIDKYFPMPALPSRPLFLPGLVVLNNRIYLIGGLVKSGTGNSFPVNEAFAYDPRGKYWNTIDPLPSPAGAQAAEQVGGLIYSIGGYGLQSINYKTLSNNPQYGAVADNCVYDPAAGRWEYRNSMRVAKAYCGSGAMGGDHIHVVGGGNNSTSSHEVYDTLTNSWKMANGPPIGLGTTFACCTMDADVYVFKDTFSFRYSHKNDRWTQLENLERGLPLMSSGAVAIKGSIYVMTKGNTLNNLIRITPTADKF